MNLPVGELFVFGFRGNEIPAWLASFAGEFGLGGVILFDYDCIDRKYERNVFNPAQLKDLCTKIHQLPSRPLVYVDQEGGKVRRLKEKYGFKPLSSARAFAGLSQKDRLAELKPAYEEMRATGIDINLAPVVDLDFNPASPDLGAFERSYSAESRVVEECVQAVVEVARSQNVRLVLKHFPGTGAARVNPHDEIMNLTNYYSEDQADIFRRLLPAIPMVLFSHGIMDQWEPGVPVCLSRKAVDIVRGWAPEAIVVTDDLQMQGVQKLMSTNEACLRSLKAGCDIILIGNNMKDEQMEAVQFAANLREACLQDSEMRARFEAALRRVRGLKA